MCSSQVHTRDNTRKKNWLKFSEHKDIDAREISDDKGFFVQNELFSSSNVRSLRVVLSEAVSDQVHNTVAVAHLVIVPANGPSLLIPQCPLRLRRIQEKLRSKERRHENKDKAACFFGAAQ